MVKRGRKNNGKLMWVSIGLVVVVVLAIVLVTQLSSSGPEQTYFGPTSPTILHEVESVPTSVFNAVGVSSPAVQVVTLSTAKDQPALTFTVGKKVLPGAFYYGAEYCPYCAATRWGMIVALSRFGTFNTLYNMLSSGIDVAPNTATFSFVGKKVNDVVTYTSKYLVFKPYEVENRNYQNFMPVTTQIGTLVNTYDNPSNNGRYSFPFMDMNNHVFITGSEFDPTNLANVSRATIAAGLNDPSIPVTQAIIATANYVSAGICAMTHSQPTSVCHSSGVAAAAATMKLKL
ncbi:MAG TPA: DUF929 family protein [Acidimicrobiales bacterium]|jgi:thiol-disulfide isomerase/thioredoxin|nr:DUF929 family protein [Acidimicrobiales bacterium]